MSQKQSITDVLMVGATGSIGQLAVRAAQRHGLRRQLRQDWAVRKGATPAQIGLAWLLAQKPWIVPIPSTTRLSHLLENVGAEEVRFSRDELPELNAAVARITVHGDHLPPEALAMTGVEAPTR